MNNINRLITLWMGKCWHNLKKDGVDGWTCIHCNRYFPYPTPNPDFSLPDHFARFTGRLFEQEDLWKAFRKHAFKVWLSGLPQITPIITVYFEAWLFHPDYYTRFVTLFAEFLRLPEIRREFGWEECPNCEQGYAIRKVGHRMEGTTDRCQFCDGTGKVLSAWAREVNNA